MMRQNRHEHTKLAMALVDSLGVDGAISACRANGWDAVLQVIRDTKQRNLPDTGPKLHHV